jgi:hypothetical protein
MGFSLISGAQIARPRDVVSLIVVPDAKANEGGIAHRPGTACYKVPKGDVYHVGWSALLIHVVARASNWRVALYLRSNP